jgi:hypothetical protein
VISLFQIDSFVDSDLLSACIKWRQCGNRKIVSAKRTSKQFDIVICSLENKACDRQIDTHTEREREREAPTGKWCYWQLLVTRRSRSRRRRRRRNKAIFWVSEWDNRTLMILPTVNAIRNEIETQGRTATKRHKKKKKPKVLRISQSICDDHRTCISI